MEVELAQTRDFEPDQVISRETHIVREDASGSGALIGIIVGALLVLGLLYFGLTNWAGNTTVVTPAPAPDTIVVPAPSVDITPPAAQPETSPMMDAAPAAPEPLAVEPPAPSPDPAPAPSPEPGPAPAP